MTAASAGTKPTEMGWFAFLLRGGSRGQKLARCVLLLVLVIGVGYLVIGPKPWVSGIESREDSGEKLRTSECVVSGLWWGALADSLIAAGLLLAAPWWQRQRILVQPQGFVPRDFDAHRRRLFWLGVTATVLWAGWQNQPRLGQSLWGDEEYTMKRHVFGFYQRVDSGEMRFRSMPWEETVFGYQRGPNNHNLFSILARLSHGSEPWADGDWYFSEAAFRLPAFLAGLGGLVTLALFARRLCGPAVGLLAPLILTLHPWFLRYAVEGRGYAFVFLLLPVMLHALVNALSTGAWRWWLLFGISQFLTFYAYPGILYTLVAQNLCVALYLGWRHQSRITELIPVATRWIIANVVSLMLVLPIYGPCVPQLLAYLKRSRVQGDIGGTWLLNEWGYIATGMPWHPWATDNPICHAVSDYAESSPLLFWSIIIAVPLVLVVGWIALACRGALHATIAVITLAAPMLMYLHNALNGSYLYHWYLVFILPLLSLSAACGICFLAGRISSKPAATAAVAALALGWFAWVTAPQRHALRHHAIEPLTGSVRAMRGDAMDPRSPAYDDTLTFHFHMYTEAYDCGAYEARSVAAVRELAARADAEGKPLFVNYAQRPMAIEVYPELVAMLDDPAIFEPVGTFYGLEPQCTRYVLKYRPGALTE